MDWKPSVLLVDDERDIVETLKPSLEGFGLIVTGFYDSQQAISHFRAKKDEYHVIVSDLRMPGLNGLELIKVAKSVNPDLKAILLSSSELAGQEQKVLSSYGIDHFMNKPVMPSRLVQAINGLLRG